MYSTNSEYGSPYLAVCHVMSRIQAGVSGQHESKPALFNHQNAWRSPTCLMKVSMVRSAVLAIYRNLSSTESSSSPIDGVYHCRCQITYV